MERLPDIIISRFWNVIPNLSQCLTNLMHKICFTVSFVSHLYMFRAHVLIIRRSKLHYKASGIITRIGGRLVHETATYTCDNARGFVSFLFFYKLCPLQSRVLGKLCNV